MVDALQQDFEGDPRRAEVEQDFGEFIHFDMIVADSDPDASAPSLPSSRRESFGIPQSGFVG